MTPSQTSSTLRQLDHRPRKSLGQNFLVDANIVAKSIRLADVKSNDRIVEVGPGLGTLTRSLLEADAEIWAVEFDPGMVNYLHREVVPTSGDRLHLIQGDAVKHPRAGLPDSDAQSGFKVVANLPYAISTPWLDASLRDPLPDHMVLMLQKETADRFSASPGSKKFGAISIFLQSAFEILKGHPVPRSCFHPPPDVDSYLLNLRRKDTPFLFSTSTKSEIRKLFQQRRKQIGSLVKRSGSDASKRWLEELTDFGLSTKARPEEIPIEAWQKLENATQAS